MSLPPGFRFHPTDVELIMYYLKRKVLGKKFHFKAISELNIYKFSPWDLPDKSCLKSKDLEWYFFCPRERKYASGARMNRATETGYWKTTGKDRAILYNESNVGMVKTLVFHRGAAPRGERTDWVIHEYRIQDKQLADAGIAQDSFVLCKVFQKNGPGPKNGAQYGAPFKEEEWDDDVQDCCETLPFGGPSTGSATTGVGVPENPCCSIVTSKGCPETTSLQSLPGPGPSSDEAPTNVVQPDLPVDDIHQFLASFTENSSPPPIDHIAINEMLDANNYETVPCPERNGFYHNVGEFGNWPELGDGGNNFSAIQEADYVLNSMLYTEGYLELNDLAMPLNSSDIANVSELVPTSNLNGTHNAYGDLQEIHHRGNPFGMNLYNNTGLSELMPLHDRSGAVGFTDILQGNGDASYLNQAHNAAYSLNFTDPDARRGVELGSNGTNVNQVYNAAAYSLNFTNPHARRGIEHVSDGTYVNQAYDAAYNMPLAEPNEYR